MGIMGLLMGLWDSIHVFGKILVLTKLYHSQSVFYKVRWNYYKLQQLSLLITTMDGCYKFRQLFITSTTRFIVNCDDITKCADYYKL